MSMRQVIWMLGLPLPGLLFMAVLRCRQQRPSAAKAYAFASRFTKWGAFVAISLLFAMFMRGISSDDGGRLSWKFFGLIGAIPFLVLYSFGVLMPILYFGNSCWRRSKASRLK